MTLKREVLPVHDRSDVRAMLSTLRRDLERIDRDNAALARREFAAVLIGLASAVGLASGLLWWWT